MKEYFNLSKQAQHTPSYDKWKYKNFICEMQREFEDDNVKIFHTVTPIAPEGVPAEAVILPLSPYRTWDRNLVEQWIEKDLASEQGRLPKDRVSRVNQNPQSQSRIGPLPGQGQGPITGRI